LAPLARAARPARLGRKALSDRRVWPVALARRANVARWALPARPANRAPRARRAWPARRANAAPRALRATLGPLGRLARLVSRVLPALKARRGLPPNRPRPAVILREP
jgi:hypothetical protein